MQIWNNYSEYMKYFSEYWNYLVRKFEILFISNTKYLAMILRVVALSYRYPISFLSYVPVVSLLLLLFVHVLYVNIINNLLGSLSVFSCIV